MYAKRADMTMLFVFVTAKAGKSHVYDEGVSLSERGMSAHTNGMPAKTEFLMRSFSSTTLDQVNTWYDKYVDVPHLFRCHRLSAIASLLFGSDRWNS